MTVRISRELLDRLRAIAAADPLREVCGLLLGRGSQIEAIAGAANVATDPRRTFEIDPRVQIDAVKAARAGGLPVIGCYHSHPGGEARPSQTDFDMAHPGELWLIFAGPDVTVWRREAARFQQLRLVVG